MDLVKRGANAAVQQKSAKKKFNSAADQETAQPTTSSGSTEGNAEVAPTKLDGPSQYYKRREAPCAGTGRALAQTPKNHPTHFTALWLGGRYGRKRRLLFRAWIFGPKLKITIYLGKEQTEADITKATLQLRLGATKHIHKYKALYKAAWCKTPWNSNNYQRAG